MLTAGIGDLVEGLLHFSNKFEHYLVFPSPPYVREPSLTKIDGNPRTRPEDHDSSYPSSTVSAVSFRP